LEAEGIARFFAQVHIGCIGRDRVEPGSWVFDFWQGRAFEPDFEEYILDDFAGVRFIFCNREDKAVQVAVIVMEERFEGLFVGGGDAGEEGAGVGGGMVWVGIQGADRLWAKGFCLG